MPTPGGVSSMMPTPGSAGSLMQPGAGGGGLSSMIPTPGSGNNLMTSVTHGTGTGNVSNLMSSMSHGAGTMMPTPGTLGNMMPIQGHNTNNMFGMSGTNMMPTPGGGSGSNYSLVPQQTMAGMRMAQTGHVASSMGMSVGSQMIPTPGLSSSQGLGISTAPSAGLGGLSNGSSAQIQQFGGGATNHIYSGMTGQLGGGVPTSGQQQRKPGVVNGSMTNAKMLVNGQQLLNGAANLHTPPAYLNASQYSSLQLQQQQQRITQQQQIHHHQQQQHRPQQIRMQRMCTFLYFCSQSKTHFVCNLYAPCSASQIGLKMLRQPVFPFSLSNQLLQCSSLPYHFLQGLSTPSVVDRAINIGEGVDLHQYFAGPLAKLLVAFWVPLRWGKSAHVV